MVKRPFINKPNPISLIRDAIIFFIRHSNTIFRMKSLNIAIMRTFTKLKNQAVPYFDIIKRIEDLETSDQNTQELLKKIVQAISSMQELQNEAKEETKKIGFINE